MTLKRLLAGMAGVAAIFISGCAGGGGGTGAVDPQVMFLNASVDAGALDFLLNDTVDASGLTPSQASPFATYPFISDADGGYDVSYRDHTTLAELDRAAVTFAQNTSTIVLVTGERTPAAGDQLKGLLLSNLTVDRSKPNGSKARLIVIHAFERMAGMMTPSIIFQNPGTNVANATPAITPGSNATLTVDSGNQNWEAKRSDGEAIYATANNQVLAAGAIYLVVVGGVEGGTGATAPSITFLQIPTN